MTAKEKLKNQLMICNRIFTENIGAKCEISLPASGKFRLSFGENLQNYIDIWIWDFHAVHYFKFEGTYEEFMDTLDNVRDTAKFHRAKIETLIELAKEYEEKGDTNGHE